MKSKGVFSQLLGSKKSSTQQGYNLLFVTSAGRLSSFDPHGHLNWQVSRWKDEADLFVSPNVILPQSINGCQAALALIELLIKKTWKTIPISRGGQGMIYPPHFLTQKC